MTENTKKKVWGIPVVWQQAGTMKVEAESLDEAIEKALGETPLPKDSYYIEDSCEVDNEKLYDMTHE